MPPSLSPRQAAVVTVLQNMLFVADEVTRLNSSQETGKQFEPPHVGCYKISLDRFCPTTSGKLAFVNNSPWHGDARRFNLVRF